MLYNICENILMVCGTIIGVGFTLFFSISFIVSIFEKDKKKES